MNPTQPLAETEYHITLHKITPRVPPRAMTGKMREPAMAKEVKESIQIQ